MSNTSSQVLKVLWGITRDQINEDRRWAEEDLMSVVAEIKSLYAAPEAEKTPEIHARISHLMMIQAHGLCHRESLEREIMVFYAGFGASAITHYAEVVALDQGACAKLAAQLKGFRTREGFSDDEPWALRDEGPEDYQALNVQLERELERVSDTVFSFALRRYQLNDAADLFESDSEEFDIQREIGRRAVMPEGLGELSMMDSMYAKRYGQGIVTRIASRAREIREHAS